MTLDTLKLTALTTAIVAVPALALAQLDLGETIGTTEAEIRAALEAKGATVLEIEIEQDEIEVEYVLDGVNYEAELTPDGGLVSALEIDDADDDSYDDDEDDDDKDGDDEDDDEEDSDKS